MCVYQWVTFPNLPEIFGHDRFPQTENLSRTYHQFWVIFCWVSPNFNCYQYSQTCSKESKISNLLLPFGAEGPRAVDHDIPL